ncbi:universal stress protein [Magnetospirillum sulfuroxidans]|uniref:Universal stress protein n=1 Tax=Magnetospirillum sulfuroxidans TaxID=611300 RepID=A0ABS5IBD4_9PROT|nr:universal stress protein [Magnetospirillum sulfuroxidans]MBR9971700.1 universal stress protein [Magnetospirillum sulfuroxidans]
MSTIKTILAPIAEAGAAPAPLEAAFRLAELFSAHVTVLHVLADPTTAVPLIGEGMSGAMVEEMLNAAEAQSRASADAARAVYEDLRARHGIAVQAAPPAATVTTDWVEVVGREEEVVAHRGRVHDLVVMGHAGAGSDDASGLSLNAALLDSGRPLLLAPASMPASLGKRVVIAWNGSAESGRAVAAALPILEQAEAVSVLTVNEHDTMAGADDLIAFLGWHGISASHQDIPAGGNAGMAVLDACKNAMADLLVMGAYTHSRLRQLIMGGVTRHVLSHADIPVLLSH